MLFHTCNRLIVFHSLTSVWEIIYFTEQTSIKSRGLVSLGWIKLPTGKLGTSFLWIRVLWNRLIRHSSESLGPTISKQFIKNRRKFGAGLGRRFSIYLEYRQTDNFDILCGEENFDKAVQYKSDL